MRMETLTIAPAWLTREPEAEGEAGTGHRS